MNAMVYRFGMWLISRSNNAGAAAWRELQQRTDKAERDYYQADRERWDAIKALNAFRASIQIADALISSDQPEKAQSTLRVALVASRDVRPVKYPPLGKGLSMLS